METKKIKPMKTNKAKLRGELWAAHIESQRNALRIRARENHAATFELPSAEIMREAMAGVFKMRTGKLLANAPAFKAKPLAHVLHKQLSWHGGIGQMGGWIFASWNCNAIVERKGLSISGRELFDQMDNLAIVMRAGKSNALSNWARVLGGNLIG